MVEYASFPRCIGLEGVYQLIRGGGQLCAVDRYIHKAHWVFCGIRIGRHIFACGFHFLVYLLTEFQCPVKRWRVVVNQFCFRSHFAHGIHHGGDLLNIGLFGFDPQQISAMFQAGNAVQYYAVEASIVFKRVQAVVQALRLRELAIDANSDVAIFQIRNIVDHFGIEEVIVLAAKVTRLQ